MSKLQSAVCRSGPWRAVAGSTVLPWSLQGRALAGDVLEIGAGSGAMAAELLARHPHLALTATDFDPDMVEASRVRLGPFGDRATVQQADATALPFPDRSFDAVLSWMMLHHTVDWERALAEAVRVLRPGGHLIGHDLLASAPLRLLHRHDDHLVRLMTLAELRGASEGLPVDQVVLVPGLAGLVVRFTLRRGPARLDRRA